MIAHMNPRQFKKLCEKCYQLVLLIDPRHAGSTYCPRCRDEDDGWYHAGVLKGTKGFGGMVGYYEPEWSDHSAWHVLHEMVFWHFAEYKTEFDIDEMYPTYPAGLKPRTWQDVLALGERMALETRKGGAT